MSLTCYFYFALRLVQTLVAYTPRDIDNIRFVCTHGVHSIRISSTRDFIPEHVLFLLVISEAFIFYKEHVQQLK